MRLAVLFSATVLAACASLPPGRAERGLYVDLHRTVESAERAEWIVDSREIDDAASTALRSACQTSPRRRKRLLRWIDRRIVAEGGPAEAAYRRSHDLDAVEDLLTLERIRALLAYVDAAAETECPFWLGADPRFAGVQSDAHRLVLLLESAGGGQIVLSGGQFAFGGMGGGRILPAWGFGQRLTVGFGPEVGGDGAFPRAADGERRLEAQFLVALPVVLRFHDSTQYWDVDVAPTGRFTEAADFAIRPGARIAIGTGLVTLRVGNFMPFAGLWIGYEIQPPWRSEPTAHSFRLGSRFGLDWDP